MSTLKVFFANVWCLPGPFTDNRYSSDKRAKLIVPFLTGYDVVLLCEAWTREAKNVFLKTYPYQYTDNGVCGKIFGTGLMILSKYPILNPSYEIYDHSADTDWFSGKGIMHFQILFNSKQVDFFLTHMQATYKDNSEGSQVARLYQSLQLSKFVNKKLANNNSQNVFLLGDFNLYPFPNINYTDEKKLDDNMLRSASYDMIKNQTGMIDLQTSYYIYRYFTRRTDNTITITKIDNQHLSDSDFIKIDIPL